MQPFPSLSLYFLHDGTHQNLKPSLCKEPTLSLQLVKPLQFAFLLPIAVFYLFGFCDLKSWPSSGIHHLIQGGRDVNSSPTVAKQLSHVPPEHHLHGSNSSLNHWATSSTSSPTARRHCICLQHDLLTALKSKTGHANAISNC